MCTGVPQSLDNTTDSQHQDAVSRCAAGEARHAEAAGGAQRTAGTQGGGGHTCVDASSAYASRWYAAFPFPGALFAKEQKKTNSQTR